MEQDKLNEILRLHRLWLRDNNDGKRADLRDADLRDACLICADLSYTDLTDADLRGADLSYADLWHTVGNMSEVFSMQLEAYPITWTENVLQIGCENHTIKEWFNFDDKTINKMDDGALEWWLKYKDFIRQAITLTSPPQGDKQND